MMVETADCTRCGGIVLSGVLSPEFERVCPRCLMGSLFDPREAAEARSPAELLIGRQVGGYTLVGLLGRGGMGVVYRARQRGLDRYVALKVLNPPDGAGAEEVGRFLSEARAAARLQHPGIVAIHEVGSDGGIYFLAMELVEGLPLSERLLDGTLSAREAAALAAKVARAVQFAHDRRIIHRDLKPSNLILAGDEPKVMDFGLARDLSRQVRVTQSGAVMGTPAYMAPEQALGQASRIDARTDVYGLGAVLYECLAGRPPFEGATPQETLARVVGEEPPPLGRGAVDLERVCLKALAKEPADRYATAAEMADDLERFLCGEPVLARPASWARRLRSRVRRNPWAWAGMTATLFALLPALAGLWILAHRPQPPEASPMRGQDARERALVGAERARALNAQGHYLDARTAADEALVIDRETPEAWFELGFAQEHTGELAAAREAYDQAVLLRPQWNEAHYRRVISRVCYEDMDLLLALAGLAPIYDFETVRDSLEALRRWEAVPEYAHTVAGIVAMAEGRNRAAQRDFTRAAEANPGHADAWFLKGLVSLFHDAYGLDEYREAEGRERAREAMERALAIDPSRVEASLVITFILSTGGDADGAVECAEHAVQLAPQRSVAHLARALALTTLDRKEEAIASVGIAQDLSPGSPLPFLARVFVRCFQTEAGRASFSEPGLESARRCIADLDAALERDPQMPLAYLLRAIMRLYRGELDGVTADLDAFEALSSRYRVGEVLRETADGMRELLERRRPDLQRWGRAWRALDAGQWDEVEAVAREVRAMPAQEPEPGDFLAATPAMADWLDAKVALGRGDRAAATERLRAAIHGGLIPAPFLAEGWESLDDAEVHAWVAEGSSPR